MGRGWRYLGLRLLSGGAAVACVTATAVPAHAAGGSADPLRRPAIGAVATQRPPRIDGRLDDPCWLEAPALTDFTQVVPVEGAAPSERTEVRFVRTRDTLYIAIRSFDGDPRGIIAKQMQHDDSFSSDDLVTVAFDTFGRRRDGYFFSVNPAGARTDGLIENFSERKREWDAVWDARCRVDDLGWTAEIAIPLRSLSFDAARDSWGCNIERVIRRKQETLRWTATRRAASVTTLSDFGELTGLAGLRQGLGLELRPALSATYDDDGTGGGGRWRSRPGGDVTYRITPSLTANATIRTDFAEAEVDDRRVNLTRFPVSFPEKRDFFLQDSSLFSFGGLSDSPIPFSSRRIGLSDDGQPVDIIAGGRLTGRIGRTQVAFLDVRQDASGEVPEQNLLVARVSTSVLEESNVGIIATRGDPRSAGDDTLLGADFNFLNSRLPAGKRLVGHAWFMETNTVREALRDRAYGAVLDFPNEPFSARLEALHLGEDFNPALGFLSRNGIRRYVGSAEYEWRLNTDLVRSISASTKWEYVTDLEGRILGDDNDVAILSFETPAEDELKLEYATERDVVDEEDDINDVPIPAGDYRNRHGRVTIETSEARPLSMELSFRAARYYTGRRYDYEVGADWRPSGHFTASASYELDVVRLDAGGFDARVLSLRLNVAFTPDLTWNTLAQYDNESRDVGVDSRLRWTWRAGNDVFIVVNRGWEIDDGQIRASRNRTTVKTGVTFGF